MSVYKVVELIGTSSNSWEEATRNAITDAAKTLRHLRVAEVAELDVTLTDDGKIDVFRSKVKVSVKHEGS